VDIKFLGITCGSFIKHNFNQYDFFSRWEVQAMTHLSDRK